MEADRSGLSPYVLALVVGPDQFVEIFRDDNDRDAFAIEIGRASCRERV